MSRQAPQTTPHPGATAVDEAYTLLQSLTPYDRAGMVMMMRYCLRHPTAAPQLAGSHPSPAKARRASSASRSKVPSSARKTRDQSSSDPTRHTSSRPRG